jgi:DNA (cytosine-5)-methyltransferase 1
MLNFVSTDYFGDLTLTKPTVLSLFSGAGGLDLGLEKAGFEVKVCVEKIRERCQSIKKNRPSWNPICADIGALATENILDSSGLSSGEVGIVSAGPPCQPFSKAAFWVPRRLNKIGTDSQVSLLKQFAKVVKESKPAGYIMENVQGLTYKPCRPILENVISLIRKAGYTASVKVLNAVDYGIPQKRQRLFIIGAKNGIQLRFPKPTHSEIDTTKRPYVTSGDAIAELDDGEVKEDEKVGGKWGHLLPEIPPGQNYLYLTKKHGYPHPRFKWRSRYWSFLLKLSPNLPSWTIQAQPGPYVGPFHWRNRYLRISEIKRLQTFPDNWVVVGNKKEKWAQIANAVPPRLAQEVGQSILKQLVEACLVEVGYD